ncbi:MAG: cytochrome c [Candidatus Hydrogenedentes bacterium]|nr:cytochrome c [Candidatus Hydrogenedentota bacterium]
MLALMGCHPDMWNQPRFAALQKSGFFTDGRASRDPVPGTIQYDGQRRPWKSAVFEGISGGQLTVPSIMDDTFYTGRQGEGFKADNYFPVSAELLARGRERYDVTCTPCHGFAGDGFGVVTRRGFPNPPSFHIDRLREVEDGYLFDVMTNGFGRMYSYAARVTPEDRWAIAAYIRALQFSQYAPLDTVPADVKEAILNPQPVVENPADSSAAHH